MNSIESIQNIIGETISQLHFDKEPQRLYKPIEYILSLGGKRIRPMFSILACELFDGDIKKCLFPAIGLEIFHNFTLLHDDIMDQSPIRRGKETVYKKWNTNIAILSGDTMFAIAFEYLIKTDNEYLNEILTVFNTTAIEVCEGQQYDMDYEDKEQVSISEYLNMIRLKTAVLIAASLKIGAIIAKAPKEETEKIYNFGIALGMAFQLQDDLLDVYADENVFGKKIGNDIVTNKKTYLYLKAFELASENDHKILKSLFSNSTNNNEEKIKDVVEIYEKLKINTYTQEIADKYFDEAMQFLNSINVPEIQKENLKNYIYQFIDRKF